MKVRQLLLCGLRVRLLPAAQNPTSEEDEKVSPTASLSLAAEIHGEDDEPYDRKTEKLSQSPKTPSQAEE
jgi:hypothetical protein